jgi:CO/xanthine dehydrogenase FAD-binding subunit
VSVTDLTRYEMQHAASLDALCELLSKHKADEAPVALLAGGTDFMVEISQSGPKGGPLPLVVDISRMAELRSITWSDGVLRIGAAVSYLEMQRHADVCAHAPLIARMTHDVGGPTIQARGTLGGNLATASPAADGVAAIAAYDPIIEAKSVRGIRRIPMADLQTGYKQSTIERDEVIVAISLEPPKAGSPWIWRKVGTRLAQAISKVALAAVAEVDDGVVTRFGAAMASVAPVTALMPATRKLVSGSKLADIDAAALDAAVEADVSPIDDIRSTGAYRMHCAKAVTRGFLRELGAPV